MNWNNKEMKTQRLPGSKMPAFAITGETITIQSVEEESLFPSENSNRLIVNVTKFQAAGRINYVKGADSLLEPNR